MDGYDKNGLTPFKAWCFKNWPYLISDDMTELDLLYAVLGKVKNNIDELNNLQKYVDNYFNSLDVQGEIKNTIQKMIQEGSFPSPLPIDVVEQGIDNTGTTDVTDSLQNLIRDNVGATFYFRDGVYNLRTLVLTDSIEVILQDGAILKCIEPTVNFIKITRGEEGRIGLRNNIHWSGGTIDGNNLASVCLVVNSGSTTSLVENVRVKGATEECVRTDKATSPNETTVCNMTFRQVKCYGGGSNRNNHVICMNINTTDGRIESCNFDGGSIGLRLNGGGNHVNNCESLSTYSESQTDEFEIINTIGYLNVSGINYLNNCSSDTRERGYEIQSGGIFLEQCRTVYFSNQNSEKLYHVYCDDLENISVFSVTDCNFDAYGDSNICVYINNLTAYNYNRVHLQNNNYNGSFDFNDAYFYMFEHGYSTGGINTTPVQNTWYILGKLNVVNGNSSECSFSWNNQQEIRINGNLSPYNMAYNINKVVSLNIYMDDMIEYGYVIEYPFIYIVARCIANDVENYLLSPSISFQGKGYLTSYLSDKNFIKTYDGSNVTTFDNPGKRKSIAVFGDSILADDPNNQNGFKQILQELGWNVYNYAKAGATLEEGDNNIFDQISGHLNGIDTVIFNGGINDYRNNCNKGSIQDSSGTMGYWAATIDTILNGYGSTAKIFFIMPHIIKDGLNNNTATTPWNMVDLINDLNDSMIHQKATSVGSPQVTLIPMYEKFSGKYEQMNSQYTMANDGIHPNNAAFHVYFKPMLEKYIGRGNNE